MSVCLQQVAAAAGMCRSVVQASLWMFADSSGVYCGHSVDN